MSSGSCCESLWNWAEITVSSRWNWGEITVSGAKLGLMQCSRGKGGTVAPRSWGGRSSAGPGKVLLRGAWVLEKEPEAAELRAHDGNSCPHTHSQWCLCLG